jgi:hypothetical protein
VGTVWDDVNRTPSTTASRHSDVVVSQQRHDDQDAVRRILRITAPLGSTRDRDRPGGYSSTTANTSRGLVTTATGSWYFGDAIGGTEGTLQGYVYVDEDKNGVHGGSEGGLANVSLTLSTGQTALTDAGGFYTFSIQPGKYDIYQLDLDGYTSTTPNIVYGIVIDTGITVNQDFGDILLKDLFVEGRSAIRSVRCRSP